MMEYIFSNKAFFLCLSVFLEFAFLIIDKNLALFLFQVL